MCLPVHILYVHTPPYSRGVYTPAKAYPDTYIYTYLHIEIWTTYTYTNYINTLRTLLTDSSDFQ